MATRKPVNLIGAVTGQPVSGPAIGQTRHDTAGPGNPVATPPPEQQRLEADPNDQLVLETFRKDRTGVSHPVSTAQGIAAQQQTANQQLDALTGAITAGPAMAQQPVARAGAPAISQVSGRQVAGAPGAPGFSLAPGTQLPAMGGAAPAGAPVGAMGGLAGGIGQRSIDEVDAALAGLNPNAAAVAGTARAPQLTALDRMLGFDPSTSSAAQSQLADATQSNLSNSLALARSARGGPGAQAAAMRRAQAEGAATMSQQARDLATLRAQEEDTRKGRELQALGLGGELAGQLRGADITERGQDLSTAQSNAQRELDATIARGGLAQSERQAGVAERGQSIQGALGVEGIKQARDALAASVLSDAEKTEAQILMTQASLGYQLTPAQQIQLANLAAKSNDPTVMQYVMGGLQAAGGLALGLGSMGVGFAPGAVAGGAMAAQGASTLAS